MHPPDDFHQIHKRSMLGVLVHPEWLTKLLDSRQEYFPHPQG